MGEEGVSKTLTLASALDQSGDVCDVQEGGDLAKNNSTFFLFHVG